MDSEKKSISFAGALPEEVFQVKKADRIDLRNPEDLPSPNRLVKHETYTYILENQSFSEL